MIEIIRDNWLQLLVGQYPSGPLGGLVMTVILAVSGLVFALPCALVLALARLSPLFRPETWWTPVRGHGGRV